MVAELHKTDYELRVRILKSKVTENKNVKVDDDIIEYLAKKISSNIRELEGAYRRLCAHVELVNRPLTLDTANRYCMIYLRQIIRTLLLKKYKKSFRVF